MIYRSQVPVERLSKNTWTLIRKDQHRWRQRYYLDLTFKEPGKIYRISLGRKYEVKKNDLISKLEIDQRYVIYIDEKTMLNWTGRNLGITIIRKDVQVLYQRNLNKDYAGGLFLLGMGLFSTVMLIYYIRRNGWSIVK